MEAAMKEFWETAVLGQVEALGKKVLALLPNLLAMGIIMTVGRVAAWAAGYLVERVLRVIGLDHLCDRVGVNAALVRGGVKTDPSCLVGRAAQWVVVTVAV